MGVDTGLYKLVVASAGIRVVVCGISNSLLCMVKTWVRSVNLMTITSLAHHSVHMSAYVAGPVL